MLIYVYLLYKNVQACQISYSTQTFVDVFA